MHCVMLQDVALMARLENLNRLQLYALIQEQDHTLESQNAEIATLRSMITDMHADEYMEASVEEWDKAQEAGACFCLWYTFKLIAGV